MKKKNYLISVFLVVFAQTNYGIEKYDAITISAGAAALVASFVAGKYAQKWHDSIELKKIEQQHGFAKEAEQERNTRFHQLERIKHLTGSFASYESANKQPHTLSDKEQKNMFHEMMIDSGSIISFERDINQLETEFRKLSPAEATEHKELFEKLCWLKRALHCNQYALAEKRKELDENHTLAMQNAHVRRIENEAKAAEDLIEAIASVKKLNGSIGQSVDKMEACQARRLAELSHWQAQQVLAEAKRAEEMRDLKNLINNMQTQLSRFNAMKKALARIENELSARQQVAPTAPPAPTAEHYHETSYQPPFNPDYVPHAPHV